ncbi:transmembrane protein 131 [Cochliomyia hominivorax]
MFSYHRLWLSVLVLAIITSSMCGFANEHVDVVSESEQLKHDAPLQTQAAASLKEITETELNDDLSVELYRSIRFEPPQLDFGIWSVGTVRSHTVTLINHNRNRSVYLSSVSGRTPAFSSSFFEAKMVPPNGNTTFNVIFLPREQGAISTSLNIHTSFGKLRLMVRGIGRECPYRLKPLVGIRAPLNATLMPEIHMYNPHGRALQILEVYSSGGQFQLELPSGDSEAPKGLWEIPPLTTKPVIRIRFQGYVAGNYSAYIRIKIAEPHTSSSGGENPDKEETEEQVLVIPVEFEILSQYGLYAVNPLIEFGHITVDEGNRVPKILKHNLFLRHSKNELELNDLEFKSVTYIDGVYVEDTNVLVFYPNEIKETIVHLNDKLEINFEDKKAHTYHNVEIIIRADIFKGNLNYDINKTLILIPKTTTNSNSKSNNNNKAECGHEKTDTKRLITVRNDFHIPIAIYNVTTQPQETSDNAKLSLKLKSFETGMVIKPGLTFDIQLEASSLCKPHKDELNNHYEDADERDKGREENDLKDLANYKTVIYVYTNITNFEIPIVISSARLFVTTQTLTIWRSNISVYTKELDLGSVPLRENSPKGFILFQNRNSIPIKWSDMDFQTPKGVYYSVVYMGQIKAKDINETNDYTVNLEKANFKFGSKLDEGDIAVYTVNVQPYTTEHNMAYFSIATEYENITVNIKYSTALGRLEVDQEKLHFANCFPGKLCSSELSIRSTFKHPIQIKYINFTDSAFRFEDKNPLGSKIAPQSVTTVGRIYFRPSDLCGSHCYIQTQTDESVSFPTVYGNSIILPNFNENELRCRTELYRHFKYYFQNMDFTMTTKELINFQLNLMIELEWPQLVSGRQILPTIEVNKSQIYEVKITNPSDNPILIDYILADPTNENPELVKKIGILLPLQTNVITPSCYLTDKAVFSLVNQPPNKPILIPGLSSIMIPIRFQANYVSTFCTLLRIRNNLTLFEGVWISAKTVQSQFRLGNRKPGSQTPLLFEITEQHLNSACPTKEERFNRDTTEQYIVPQIISRRVFTARNSGELPIRIDGFWIDDQPCQGYGFQILDCSSFVLLANSSKKIEISFQSDFTVTRISKLLTLKTNLSYDVTYTLVAQLPSKGLEQCEFLLPRPPWEEKIRNAAIAMLLVTFVLVLIAVHIDYGNIIYNQSVLYEARDKGTLQPTFNLRNIAMRSTQNNSETLPVITKETQEKNKLKHSVAGERNDNSSNSSSSSSSYIMSLKKRNGKNTKVLNGETKSSTTASTTSRGGLTLADMVSWTFGTKNNKKSPFTSTNNKNSKHSETGNSNSSNNSFPTMANEGKSLKSKFSEKSLIDKMDGDMKKSQTNKKSKIVEKQTNKNHDKTETEEVKLKREDRDEKDIKREKNSPKQQQQIKSGNSTESSASKENKEKRKSIELTTSHQIPENSHINQTDKTQNSPKEQPTNSRKIGKTPGRERRKQSTQNNSPIATDLTGSSCSSSTSSSCSSNHNGTTRRNERSKTKVKATSSLKFTQNSNNTNMFPTSNSASSSPTTLAGNVFKTENLNSPVDILSPWDCGNHATFSDVLQKSQQQQQVSSATDLIQQQQQQHHHQGSLFDLISNSANGMDNSEITAALTPKRPKNTATDLGPIGSRKSPSSTPVWEPIQQSAITMQLPRPLNNTTTPSSSSSSSTASCYYPLNTNFGYNDLSTSSSSLQQHQQDIHAQLLLLQRQFNGNKFLEQQHHLQQQQQQQQHQQQPQYLNSNVLNNNWSNLSSPLWSPILGNGSSANSIHHNSTTTSSIFGHTPQAQNSTWSLTPNSTTTSSNNIGLVRPPPGLEQNFLIGGNLTTSMNSHSTLTSSSAGSAVSAAVNVSSAQLASGFNDAVSSSTVSSNSLTQQTAPDRDNMPMFNLFGGLSSIWNDNWKQSTQQQQQQTTPQNQHQQ